jgi:prepilin-type N-terminal cleavage/methylation domain-containing protein
MTRRGFTLIETVVALALTATLIGTSTMLLSSLAATFQLAASVRTITQTMRATRARAMAEGVALDVAFDASTGIWSIRTSDGTMRRTQALPAPVHFLTLPARARIRFESTGTADNGTIVLGAGSATRRIIVNQRGRVRLG